MFLKLLSLRAELVSFPAETIHFLRAAALARLEQLELSLVLVQLFEQFRLLGSVLLCLLCQSVVVTLNNYYLLFGLLELLPGRKKFFLHNFNGLLVCLLRKLHFTLL